MYRNGEDIVLKILGYLEAKYDGRNRARVCVSRRYRSSMTGLCGNMDGVDTNDIVTAQGVPVVDTPEGHIAIGDSWHVKDWDDARYELREYFAKSLTFHLFILFMNTRHKILHK